MEISSQYVQDKKLIQVFLHDLTLSKTMFPLLQYNLSLGDYLHILKILRKAQHLEAACKLILNH